jgi:hypothetical protein
MADEWVTEVGETGEVRLTRSDGSWVVTEPSLDRKTKCVLNGEAGISESDAPITVEITVTKFVAASGGGTNYLFAEPVGNDTATAPTEESGAITESGTDSTETTTESDDTATSTSAGADYRQRSLAELSGSGDYVTVEAVVDEISWVGKDQQDTPDIIGALRDPSTGERQVFVVSSGVQHPYLEEGRKFVFSGAKDHHYEKKDQVQLLITENTDFTEKELVSEEPSSDQSNSPTETSRDDLSSGDKSLGQIAQSLLDGEEFTVEQRRESSISKAKKKAKRQQRDPAIDPKLNEDS